MKQQNYRDVKIVHQYKDGFIQINGTDLTEIEFKKLQALNHQFHWVVIVHARDFDDDTEMRGSISFSAK